MADTTNTEPTVDSDEVELTDMIHTMALHDSGPSAVRYPRGNGRGLAMPATPTRLEIGKGRIVREGKKVAILSLGTRLEEAEKAAETLEGMGRLVAQRLVLLLQALLLPPAARAWACQPARRAGRSSRAARVLLPD